MPKLIQLHTFIEVVRHGGFSAAARALGMPRSTVSLHVSTLEASLETRLLKRSTRSISLTEEGALLYEQAKDELDSLDAALDSVRARAGTLSGLVRITAPTDFPTGILAGAIREFGDLEPRVRFEVLLSNTALEMVGENIDIAIGISQRSSVERIERVLMPVSWNFHASERWLERNDRPESIGEIRDFISPGNDLRGLLERQVLAGHGLPEGRIKADNQMMIRDLVLEGAGVGLLPAGLLDTEIEAGLVAPLLENATPGETHLALTFPSRADIRPRVRAFADHFAALFANV